jgi:hypothetical protein
MYVLCVFVGCFFFFLLHHVGVCPTSVCHTSVCHVVWFVHRVLVCVQIVLVCFVRVCLDGVRLWLVEPVSGTSSQCVVVLLYNVSGPCSRLLCVSCHCVMDVLSCSVMVWWLMATWMNVLHTVVARFFFFFCVGRCKCHVHVSVLASLWGCSRSVFFG